MKIQGIVNGSSAPKEFMGVMQIGFTLMADTKRWYNVQGEEEALIELREAVVTKGAEISFEYEEKGKQVGTITLVSLPKKDEKKGDWATEMTSFKQLLASAHEKFGEKMHMRSDFVRDENGKPLVDFEKKIAVFNAQVYIRRDAQNTQVFEAVGDAIGDNVTGDKIKPHWLRMAQTRAYVRALRFATNDASVAIEETNEEENEVEETGGQKIGGGLIAAQAGEDLRKVKEDKEAKKDGKK